MTEVVAPKIGSHLLMAIDKQNNRHTTPPKTHVVFIMPRFRVLVVSTKVKQVKIRVGNGQLLMITVAPIATDVTKRATICHYR